MKKVAAIQMCSSSVVEENLAVAAQLIEKAAIEGALLVVLPEMFAIFSSNESKLAIKEEFGKGKIQDFLAEQARKNAVWIVGGTLPIRSEESNKINAACLVYNTKGEAIARYDKIHLFDAMITEHETYLESASTKPGNQFVVIDTPVGKLGLAVCYDIRFPLMFTELVNRGAEIFTIPSAFTMQTGQAHWRLLTRSRAVDNFSYVIGACQSGIHSNGRKTYGHTLIVEPWGSVIAEQVAPEPGIIYADIDLKNLYRIRNSIPIFNT